MTEKYCTAKKESEYLPRGRILEKSPQRDGEKPGKKLEAAGWKRLRGLCKRQILRLQHDRARNL